MKFRFKKSIIVILLLASSFLFLLVPDDWHITVASSDVSLRFGHGQSYHPGTAIVANFGCSTRTAPYKRKGEKAYLGSTRQVVPLEIFTFLYALNSGSDIGPWIWTHKISDIHPSLP